MKPRSKDLPTHNNSNTAVTIDDITPLVTLLSSRDFVIIDKPANLRMDGDGFPDTVQTRLIQEFGGSRENYKWVHQLDFATSGVLCVAKNREAAAKACAAFEKRNTQKEYLAMVHGHVHIDSSWPKIERKDIPQVREEFQRYHNSLTQSEKKKSVGIKESDHSWQSEVKDANLKECLRAMETIIQNGTANSELVELSKCSLEEYDKSAKLRKRLRKAIKASQPNTLLTLQESTFPSKRSKYIDSTKEQVNTTQEQLESDPAENIATTNLTEETTNEGNNDDMSFECILNLTPLNITPVYFKIASIVDNNHESDSSSIANLIESNSQINCIGSFMLICPVTEIPDDFRCQLGSELDPGRYAETEVHILSHDYFQGYPVTRLRLLPRSGRRHQLRLHCLSIGHAIVGDLCYVAAMAKHRMLSKDSSECDDNELFKSFRKAYDKSNGICNRMMLHARRLRVLHENQLLFDVETKDPFVDIVDS